LWNDYGVGEKGGGVKFNILGLRILKNLVSTVTVICNASFKLGEDKSPWKIRELGHESTLKFKHKIEQNEFPMSLSTQYQWCYGKLRFTLSKIDMKKQNT